MPINGNKYDWESVEIQGPHGTFIDVTEISYNDERPIEPSYGRGSIPQGYGRKNYKATGSLTILRSEYDALRQACGGSTYTKEPLQIVVSYANSDQATVTDTLQGVHLTNPDGSATQGEEKVEMKLAFASLSPHKWGGVAAYNDGRDGAAGN